MPCTAAADGAWCEPTQIIERDAERRFELEKRLGMTNPKDYGRAAPVPSVSGDAMPLQSPSGVED